MTQQELKSAISEFYARLNPYAHVVIAPNYSASAFRNPYAASASIRRLTREIALRLDQRYFVTRRLMRDVPQSDRFDAICWPEKLSSNPHVHCAFFLNPAIAQRLTEADKTAAETQRLVFLLSSLRSPDTELTPADQTLLLANAPLKRDAKLEKSLRSLCPSATYSVSGVFDATGLARYTGKEYNIARDEAGSGFFFLSDPAP